MKVLIVDDELVSRKKMQSIMAQFASCEAAETGGQALESFKKAWDNWTPYDLISLDISMPDMNGMDVLFEIREMEKDRGIPMERKVKIMMVTSHADKDTIITAVTAGCDNYIVKPFNRTSVVSKLSKLGFQVS